MGEQGDGRASSRTKEVHGERGGGETKERKAGKMASQRQAASSSGLEEQRETEKVVCMQEQVVGASSPAIVESATDGAGESGRREEPGRGTSATVPGRLASVSARSRESGRDDGDEGELQAGRRRRERHRRAESSWEERHAGGVGGSTLRALRENEHALSATMGANEHYDRRGRGYLCCDDLRWRLMETLTARRAGQSNTAVVEGKMI